MNQMTTEDSKPTERKFGACLKQARERRGLSLAQVSAVTKVPPYSLGLVEDSNLDDLPAEVFVRGFIRAYAKTVGVPEAEPIGLLDALLADRRRSAEMAAAAVAGAARSGGGGHSHSMEARDNEMLPADALAMGFSRDDESNARRGGVVAIFVVIVLVIATITVSYLMRQPPAPGEGLSLAPALSAEPDRPFDTA